MQVLRRELEQEMKNLTLPNNKTLKDMTIETGGQPQRAMVNLPSQFGLKKFRSFS